MALYAIVIGGAVVGVYSILESGGRGQTRAAIEAEGSYMLGKIDWALTSAKSVTINGDTLSVVRNGLISSENPLVFSMQSGELLLARGSSAPQALNNTNTVMSDLQLSRVTTSASGIIPESITVSFTLAARTPRGDMVTRNFSTVKYLRK